MKEEKKIEEFIETVKGLYSLDKEDVRLLIITILSTLKRDDINIIKKLI